jgi:hypothetical protein
MPFLLYNTTGSPGQHHHTLVRQIKLAGRTGPLARHAALLNPDKAVPFRWHATAAELLPYLGASPGAQNILIDLKPRAKDVSVYQLCDVWGFSYEEWTPIELRLQSLFIEKAEPNPSQFKQSFSDAGSDGSLVAEFLYMLGGVNGGTWNWGMVGRVNGALLWKDAFDFLTVEVGTALR